MSASRMGLVLVSGFLAGGVNAIAGGGSFIAFPALLLAGLKPVPANIVSTIGLVPGYVSGTYAYRQELAGQARRMRIFGVVGLAGGVAGAVVLLVAPARVFAAIVPGLVLASCVILAFQPRLAAVVARRSAERAGDSAGDSSDARRADHISPAALGAVFLGSVYGAYFGAGLGVILLAVLGILAPDNLHRLNALKGYLSVLINGIAVLVFVLGSSIDWRSCALLAVGSVGGGLVGVRLARRLPADRLRMVIVVFGVAVSAVLFVKL